MTRKFLLVLVAVAIGGVSYDYLLLLKPRTAMIEELKNNIRTVQNELASAGQYKDKLEKLKGQYKEAQLKFDGHVKQLLQRNQVGNLLEKISRIAPQEGFSFDEVSPQDLVRKTERGGKVKLDILIVRMVARGTFAKLGQYIESLEEMPFFAEIGDLEIKQLGGDQVLMSLDLKTYLLAVDR